MAPVCVCVGVGVGLCLIAVWLRKQKAGHLGGEGEKGEGKTGKKKKV